MFSITAASMPAYFKRTARSWAREPPANTTVSGWPASSSKSISQIHEISWPSATWSLMKKATILGP